MIININIEYAEIEKRKARWDTTMSLKFADRVPVLHYLGARYWLPSLGMEEHYLDYLNDPKVMLEAQLKSGKWILENVDSDYHKIVCYPDFMWVEDVEPFGADIVYTENDSPWVGRPHLLQKDGDLDKLRQVDYVHAGIHGKMLDYYRDMKEIAGDYTLRFSDGMTVEATDLVYMAGGGIIGPMVLAGDLMSVEELSVAFYDRPEYIKELMSIIAEKSIEWLDAAHDVSNGRTAFANDYHEGFMFIGDDGIAQMSPRHFEEFALEPLKQLSDHIHGRGLKVMAHNCGKVDHLLKNWIEDVGIDRFIGFSYQIEKENIRDILGGKASIIGGIDTTILHDGQPSEVREDVRKALVILKDVPGFVLMDGHNVAPGSPVENLNTMTDAAREFGSF